MESNTGSNIRTDILFEAENILAEKHIAENNLPAAAAVLVKIVENDNFNSRAFNNLGIISWMREAWDDAFVMFKKSASIQPDYVDALVNLFDAALKLKRASQILPLLKKALEMNPCVAEIKILADSIEQQGDDLYLSERALSIGLFNPVVEEADKLLNDGKLNEAMTKYLEANDTQGPSAGAYCGLGVISYHQKRYSDALTLFVESIKLNPTRTDTFLNMLDAAKNCNKVDYAKSVYSLHLKELPALKAIEREFNTAV
jgi:tetratricopeptide (TPR) repeat protein